MNIQIKSSRHRELFSFLGAIMPTITPHPPRRLIRELPASLRPATRLAHVGSNQLTITELIAIVLNTSDALDLAQEI